MQVEIRKQGTRYAVREFRRDAERLLRAAQKADLALSILLCDDPEIRALNAQWRGIDTTTDVLSFPMGMGVLGDIVISVPTAERQAKEAGHSLEVEMRVLLVHGFLHLCGHDHHTEAEDMAMRAAEEQLLNTLGIAANGLVARAAL